MMRQVLTSIRMLLVCTVVLGFGYPLVVGGIAAVAFGHTATGSLVTSKDGGTVIGSEFVGQRFESPKYFHGRPSAAGQNGYDAMASGGSNLGPTSKQLAEQVAVRVKSAVAEDPTIAGHVPVDMVTSSGSGLDPDISPANAYAQVLRVASARNLPAATVRELVDRQTAGRQLGILGEPRVNVLSLNVALDALTAVR
jgi:potassium-transporting ATPase KdpC subunit